MGKRPNIMVCGHYACGKTSIVEAVTKAGTVPEEATNPERIIEDFTCIFYETEAVGFIDLPGMELGESVNSYWKKLQVMAQKYSPADCVWYCIDGAKTAVQFGDEELLKFAGENVIAVITRSELMTDEMMEQMVVRLSNILPLERIVLVSSKKKLGLNRLLECSRGIIYGSQKKEGLLQWDNYFSHQKDWIKNIGKTADKYILQRSCKVFNILNGQEPGPKKFPACYIPLAVNETYLIYEIGTCYGFPVDSTLLFSLRKLQEIEGNNDLSLEIAAKKAGAIYGSGCAAKAYFDSKMTLDNSALVKIFYDEEEKAKEIDWKSQTTGE